MSLVACWVWCCTRHSAAFRLGLLGSGIGSTRTLSSQKQTSTSRIIHLNPWLSLTLSFNTLLMLGYVQLLQNRPCNLRLCRQHLTRWKKRESFTNRNSFFTSRRPCERRNLDAVWPRNPASSSFLNPFQLPQSWCNQWLHYIDNKYSRGDAVCGKHILQDIGDVRQAFWAISALLTSIAFSTACHLPPSAPHEYMSNPDRAVTAPWHKYAGSTLDATPIKLNNLLFRSNRDLLFAGADDSGPHRPVNAHIRVGHEGRDTPEWTEHNGTRYHTKHRPRLQYIWIKTKNMGEQKNTRHNCCQFVFYVNHSHIQIS